MVSPDALGNEGWATWTPEGATASGTAWRCLRRVDPDGSLHRPDWPGLSYEPPAD